MSSAGKLLPLIVHPENAESEHRIHRRLRLLRINTKHGKRRLTGPQHGAGVHRAERVFQIGAAAQVLDLHSRILTQQDPLQQALILGASRLLGGALAAVAVGADLQHAGLRLPEAHHAKPEGAALFFHVEHPAHGVALLGPQMQNALAFAGYGVLRVSEFKQQLAVFDGNSLGRVGQELLQDFSQKPRRDGAILHDCRGDSGFRA